MTCLRALCVFVVAFWTALFDVPQMSAAANSNVLWYASPADEWIQALPIGNGRLGAMIFGQPRNERLQLNEITVWSGDPNPNADRKDAYKSLPELRRLIGEGKYAEAEHFANANFNSTAPYTPCYQTLGDLLFEFRLPQGEITAYRRELDVSEAIARVSFMVGGVSFWRETFASAPDQVIAQKLVANRKGAVSFTMSLRRAERSQTRFQWPATLIMTGNTGNTLAYEVRAVVLSRGGRVSGMPDGRIKVENTDEAVILLTAATTFALDYDAGYKGGDLSVAAQRIEDAARESYDALRAAHVASYRQYFDRVNLDLGGNHDYTTPTDERLKTYKKDSDPSFAVLFYQFGRYLLISSSRADNPLPANLQGIWSDGFDPPWNSDYHANINVEMIYWPAETANLNELHMPLLHMTQNLVKPGSKTAKSYFGPETPGWVLGYTTNGWSWTSPGERLPWGVWFGGSAWLSQHLWEHYAFTRDVAYLRSVYPTMKGAAQFWLATLVDAGDGTLTPSPSSSPENSFTTDDGITSTITAGTGIDRALVWDLFDNTAQASSVLGTDPDFATKLKAARDRIRLPQIGRAGQLMEWNGDWDLNAKELHHRHLSHLFPLYPGHQISYETTPKLAAAAEKSLEIRGDISTGWSLAWKINCWARLHNGERAHRLIGLQLRYTGDQSVDYADAGGTYPNLFDAHPPFQIDGNFGFVAGVNEMLLQSQQRYTDPLDPTQDHYYIDLLPAIPSAWSNGSVSGLRARGGFQVEIQWRNGHIQHARIANVSRRRQKGRIRAEGRVTEVNLNPGESIDIEGQLRPANLRSSGGLSHPGP